MTQNLALLDQAVQNSVAWELGEGEQDPEMLEKLGVSPKRYRNVGGLRVVSNAARDAIIDNDAAERRDRLLRYRTDRFLALEKLKIAGVTPIATLPLKAWNRICDSAGLYRFVPNDDVVLVKTDTYIKEARALALKDFKDAHEVFLLKFWIGWIIYAAVIFTLGFWVHGGFYFGYFMSFLSLAAVGETNQLETAEGREKVHTKIQLLVSEHRGTDKLFQNLWPNYVEPETGARIQIVLPVPPPEVQERLVNTERARMPIHVAVVPEAIHFRQNIVDILLRAHDAKVESEKDVKHPDLSRDPIAFVVEGSAVVIIDQYGDFPIEDEVITEVVNSTHLV